MAERERDPLVVKLFDVRSSYLHVFTAKAFKDGDRPRFSGRFYMDPSSKKGSSNIDKCEMAIEEAISQKWPNKAPSIKSAMRALRKFTEEDSRGEEDDEFIDQYYVQASNDEKPMTLDSEKEPTVESDGLLYSGVRCNVIVRFWVQDNSFGRRINATLLGVQYREDAPALSSRPRISADDFDDDDDDPPSRRSDSRKSRRSSEEDEDDPPRRSRRSSEDDEEDTPRRGRKKAQERRQRRSEDEDADDDADDIRSRRRGRSDDDDSGSSRRQRNSRDDDDDEYEDRPSKNSRSSRRRNNDDDDMI